MLASLHYPCYVLFMRNFSSETLEATMRALAENVTKYDARNLRAHASMMQTIIATREVITQSRALISEANTVLARRPLRS